MKRGFIAAMWVVLSLPAVAQTAPPAQPSQIVIRSQQALIQHNDKEALRLVLDGLAAFPDNEDLQLQLARVFVYEKRDAQAIEKINAVLRSNPSSRNARIELAQINGYHEDYKRSDPIYRQLLSENPGDETAALGLIHNLVLEGRRNEARRQLQAALQRHPTSLLLLEYNDFLAAAAASAEENRTKNFGRVQTGESFFTDSSGNRSLSSSQAFAYQIMRNLSSRTRLDETSLWKTAAPTLNVVSGTEELRWRFNKYLALRAAGGAIRFADSSSDALYSGDLELSPFKGLVLSGGYSQFPVLPTFEAASFNLLAAGWHERVDYRTSKFSLNASGYLSRYSDSNRAEREYGDAMRWFGSRAVSVGAGYALRHIHYTQELNNGYFSPSQYWSHLGAGGLRLNAGKFYRGEYIGYLGAEKINTGPFTSAGEFSLRNQFFYHRWDFEANYSHFQLVQSSAAFRSEVISGAIGYRF